MIDPPQPWEALFAGLNQLGPGSDACTREALSKLPSRSYRRVVDADCGAGRQTLVLARELDVPIEALDTHPPFLERLAQRAHEAGLAAVVRPRRLDMADLAAEFANLDLIWSEGAVYNLGFERALRVFALALRPGGCVALTECTWLSDERPPIARDFWQAAYPAMTTTAANCQAARGAGFNVLETFALPPQAWTEGFYDLLRQRAEELLLHPAEEVRAFAVAMLQEIAVFDQAGHSYGYVFYLLEYPGAAP